MSLRSAAAAVLLFLCAFTANAQYYEDRLKETTNYLKDIKKQLDEERRQIDKIEDTKKSVALKVANLNESLKAQADVIASLNLDAERIDKEVKSLEAESRKLNGEIAKIKDSIETSNIYLIDNTDFVNVKLLLFTKESRDTVKNMELVENINTILMARADEIKTKSDRLEQIKEESSRRLRDVEHLIRVRANVVKEYNTEKIKLNQLAAVMEHDRESKQEYIKILADKQKDFESKLDRIRKQLEESKKQEKAQAADSSAFGKLKGTMDWPMQGAIIEFFGPKKVEGFQGTINNNGIKIRPDKHGEVRAVTEGTVRYVDNIRGFGNLVIVGHAGSYYTLYANMAGVSVQTGEKIAPSQVIGLVSVDLQADTPYLYFEIRRGNQAINPTEWLKPIRR